MGGVKVMNVASKSFDILQAIHPAMNLFRAFLKVIFGLKKTINDSFFGKMKAFTITANGKKVYCLRCRKNFPDQKEKVNINILNDQPEIQESQRDMIRSLITDYTAVAASINAKIANSAYMPHKYTVNDICNGFILQSIDMLQEDSGVIYWKLTYMKDNIFVNVEFAGDNIENIDIDSF